ncbi:hydroxymethylglutaryl-CoA lyase [Nitritalea halalkaliphila LW7]|uniref:Hydroxymethylglutaryl-CoA lyase n=1 Tax=Nitritalea halalkaliphila LW7 TaxID=1189621 RepID=I5C7C5_9BACT|nr:hydroxymethylglutaryl-CoA lyase [Nitritalea halalkaliphila]EIM77727.1 hydroxymethylglutaryl-CoA lyase [Nitritalea halalkaliphila LW7]
MSPTDHVELLEVSPRDGIQNEPYLLTLDEKELLVRKLLGAGFPAVEVGAFVSPKAVPTMAGTGELLERLADVPQALHALIPNVKGYELGRQHGAKHLSYVLSLTETMNQRNVRMSVAEGLEQVRTLARRAKEEDISFRVYLAVAFHCPFEGPTPAAHSWELLQRIADWGVADICLADTDGHAEPEHAATLLGKAAGLLGKEGAPRISLHFHQTYGFAEANVRQALALGYRHFDTATAGLGGCPFVPGAKGNVPAEELVRLCAEAGYSTSVDVAALATVGSWLKALKIRKQESHA